MPKLLYTLYVFDDGVFRFYTANLDIFHRSKVVFRVREDMTPEDSIKEKGIDYWCIDPSTLDEIASWFNSYEDIGDTCK